jgi:hypothetical protein
VIIALYYNFYIAGPCGYWTCTIAEGTVSIGRAVCCTKICYHAKIGEVRQGEVRQGEVG